MSLFMALERKKTRSKIMQVYKNSRFEIRTCYSILPRSCNGYKKQERPIKLIFKLEKEKENILVKYKDVAHKYDQVDKS